jgi:hypothetical protein
MKRKTTLVMMGMVLSVLVVQLLVETRPSYAYFDCKSDRWEAFMNANDTYTTSLRSWYWQEPVSCLQQCSDQCQSLSGSVHTACMDSCLNNYNDERFNTFNDAQDALISAVNQSCPFNPDFCDQARYNRDQCVATYNLEWHIRVSTGMAMLMKRGPTLFRPNFPRA